VVFRYWLLKLGVPFVSLFLGSSSLEAQRPASRRAPDQLREGDMAPDFELSMVDGKRQVRLSSFRGKKLVALVFGSYT
jgi:hypothetical protein